MTRSFAVVIACLAVACERAPGSPGDPVGTPGGEVAIALQEVARLTAPTFLTSAPGDSRIFVLEQAGRVRVIENGALLPTSFLDITDRVGSGGERGLLGLAFHPSYASNGFFFINYTDRAGDTRIERYRVSSDRSQGDAASAKLLLTIDQPFANHNGGMVAFGADGMLYIGMGDGGSGGDPQGHGQNLNSLLGKILRIDVDRGDPYAIPPDNPFAGRPGARGEIWAYGLRNPWRFSFDRPAGRLYLADVGQNAFEEVNVVSATTAGINYGWNRMEGTHCFNAASCDRNGLQIPQVDYGRADGCSVTGGYVYRGTRIPALVGHYFYADFCQAGLRSFRMSGDQVTDARRWALPDASSVSSFGVDSQGELYVVTLSSRVFRIVPG